MPDSQAAVFAADEYFETEKPIRKLWRQLGREQDPRRRARIITEGAAIEDKMAVLHRKAFGPDPQSDEDGRDVADSLAYSARVLRLMASVENGVADGGRRRPTDDALLESVAGSVCDQMTRAIAAAIEAGNPDAANRDVQHGRLCQAVVDTVGGQAAEGVACLPSPRKAGLLTRWSRLSAGHAYDAEYGDCD